MRVQPFALPRAAREERAVELTDPLLPGETIHLRLRALSNTEAYAAVECARDLIRTYVTGDDEKGIPPVPFPAIGGEVVQVNETLLTDVASIEKMQVPGGEQPYTAEELVALAETLPTAFEQLQRAIHRLNSERRASEGNGSGATTAPSSESPSGTTGSIPN